MCIGEEMCKKLAELHVFMVHMWLGCYEQWMHHL